MSEAESIVCPNCGERSPAGYVLCPYCGFDLTKIVRETHRVRVTFRERFSRIWRSFSDPRLSETLFAEIGVNPDRLGAIMVLYLVSVAYALRMGAFVIKASTPSWHDLALWFFIIAPWIVGFAFIFFALFAWIVSGIVVWLSAKTLGGKASLRDTMGIVGYSFGPLIPASLLISVLIIILGQGAPLGSPITSITPLTSESYVIFEYLYIPFFGWTAYNCGNGIRAAHLLSNLYSYAISGLVALVYVILYFFL
ncbi:MAG: YIP1 family protein [Candidatus Thorarchaeota archaeon]